MARAERERRMNRLLLGGTAVVFILVIGLVSFGVIQQVFIWPRQPVAMVEGEEIPTEAFQARVRFERLQLIQQYDTALQNMQLLGSDENIQAFFANTLQQIQSQLQNPTLLGRDVLNRMIDEVLIRQAAEERGIMVTEEELDRAFQEAFGFFPAGTPTPQASPTTLPTPTLSATQLALVTPFATGTPTATVTATPTIQPSATPTITLPTATPYTRDAFQSDFGAYVASLEEQVEFDEADLRNLLEAELYREKLREAVTADLPAAREEVWARHILVPSEATAHIVLDRLEAGEDWSDVAAQMSTDESNREEGGDLGWFARGRMVAPFEEVAFELDVGEISEPVETEFGWHVIQVLGHEMRPVTPAQYQTLRDQAFSEWLEEQRAEAEIDIVDNWPDRVPDEPELPVAGAPAPPAQPGQ